MRHTVILSIMLFILFPTTIFAADWTLEDEGTIQSIRAFSSTADTYVAAGNSGHRIYSEDGGQTWITPEKTSSTWWYDMANTDEKMYVIGASGVVMYSEDNGITWDQISIGTTYTLSGIELDGQYGYIVGEFGTGYYFANNQWITTTTNTTRNINAVQNMGDGTGWAVTDEGWLYYITGGGIAWTGIGQVASTHLNDVYFSNASEGWLTGNDGVIKYTDDGGSSWVTVSVDGLLTQDLHAIEVLDDEMVIVGDEIILYSDDSGETWEVTEFSDRSNFYTAHVDQQGEFWIAGSRDDSTSLIYRLEREEEEIIEEETEEETTEETVEEETEETEETEAQTSTLIKIVCEEEAAANDPCKAVYYYGDDGKRHAFPNERVFFTWYEDFDDVQEVSAEFMASIQLGANVTYRPGVKMVKFQSVNTVYAVSAPAQLRPIASESVAEELYGSEWNTHIDDIPDVFIGNYSFGEEIESAQDYDSDEQESNVSGISDIF